MEAGIIREISIMEELFSSCSVMRNAFRTVAEEFGLTPENAPSNTAFITLEQLQEIQSKGIKCFGLFLKEKQVGFVAAEKVTEELYYLEKLAVLPDYRHHGCGVQLMDYVFDYVRSAGGKKISIGLIAENKLLREWYLRYGFIETGTKTFPHLPFTVCFMDKELTI